MPRDLPRAVAECTAAEDAIASGDLPRARAALANARRALNHWGTGYPVTDEQATRMMERAPTTDPIVVAAEWLQLADDKLHGDTVAGGEPYLVREYLAQDDPEHPPASAAVIDWLRTHRTAWPRSAKVFIMTARATLEGR